MAPMKIALMSFEYPSETGFGGIGTYTWYQARALVKLGHEVHVLAGAAAPTRLRTETHDGVVVHRYHADGALMRLFGRLDRSRLWWTKNRLENGLSMYRALRILTERHAYDVVEMPECGAEGWLVNHLTRSRTIVRFHSPARLIMGYYEVRRADVMLCSTIERLAMMGAGAFTACSRFLAGEVRLRLGIRSRVEVIPNGIDLELFDAAEQVDVRREYDLPRDRPLILFAGRMEPRKGIHLCREIVPRILERHKVGFAFAGRDLFGHMTSTLLPEVRSRKLRGSLHYLGDLSLTAVRSCVRQADIFLLPSLWENCPYSCLEAMAAGRAIVCSDQGGMPELIRDGVNGLLAQNGDPGSFVIQLERLIEDRPLAGRLGAAARRTIEDSFTDLEVARSSAAYYRECLAGS
jgi:glycogen synthase